MMLEIKIPNSQTSFPPSIICNKKAIHINSTTTVVLVTCNLLIMNAIHRDILKNYKDHIIKHIQLDVVLKELAKLKVLTTQMTNDINSKSTLNERVVSIYKITLHKKIL